MISSIIVKTLSTHTWIIKLSKLLCGVGHKAQKETQGVFSQEPNEYLIEKLFMIDHKLLDYFGYKLVKFNMDDDDSIESHREIF